MQLIYLDNNATTQPAPPVVKAMQQVHEHLWANPSSVHRFGQQVRQRIELARQDVAQLIGCRDRELVFTSGGTESNNLAINGVLTAPHRGADTKPRVLITTKVEHTAIREPAEALERAGVQIVFVPVDHQGCVNPADVSAAIQEHAPGASIVLVSMQWANNETGIIQPIGAISDACINAQEKFTDARIFLHTDATQAVGKIPVNVGNPGVDLMTLSGHKLHGPKGIGALYIRSGVRLWPQVRGGPQERERRGGTENSAGIIGLGVAASLAAEFVGDQQKIAHLTELRDGFEQTIVTQLPTTVINSSSAQQTSRRLWNTSNLGFPRLEAEAILLGLSERGVCASAGAACSSGSLEPSPVLLAMGIPETIAHGSVRFSISRYTTEQELAEAARIVIEVVRRVGKTLPMGV